MTEYAFADKVISIYDKLQNSAHRIMLIKEGSEIRCTKEGSEKAERTMLVAPHKVIGIYDSRCKMDDLEADLREAMR